MDSQDNIGSPSPWMWSGAERDTNSGSHESPKMTLVVGSVVNIDGRERLVERRLQDSWQFLDPKTNEPCSRSDIEIAKLQSEGQFFVVWQPGDRADISVPQNPLNIGEKAHAQNLRKREYVEGCVKDPKFCRSRGVLGPIAEAIAQKRGENAPSFQSLLNWIARYDRYYGMYGPAAFSDRHDKKGKHGDRLPEYQERAVRVGIDYWLKGQSKTNAYASVC